MAVLIPLSEVAVGDYSTEYGTVSKVEVNGDSIMLTFVNEVEVTQNKDEEMEFDQGGRF